MRYYWKSWKNKYRAIRAMLHDPSNLRRKLKRFFCPIPRELKEYRSILRMPIGEWILYHQKVITPMRRKGRSQMTWMGLEVLKLPTDLWIFQEIIFEVKPDIIVDIGSYVGGTSLFYAHLLDIIGNGQVIAIEITPGLFQAKHERIIPLTGDCSSPEILSQVQQLCLGKRVMVIHDGAHDKESVLRDLRHYAPLVSKGSYLIVEDGIGDLYDPGETFGIHWGLEEGPLPAILEFLKENVDFISDTSRERYLITAHPRGYLRRIA